MDNRNSVHTKELAVCKPSPSGVHYWVQSIQDSPIFFCVHCKGFRAFNIKAFRYNPYSSKEFMKVYTLDSLPHLMSIVDRRHKDVDVEKDPSLWRIYPDTPTYKKSTKHKDKSSIFDRKARRVVRNGEVIWE